MGHKILSITTDQQRCDSLGCNGRKIARTPVADRLAAAGLKSDLIADLYDHRPRPRDPQLQVDAPA